MVVQYSMLKLQNPLSQIIMPKQTVEQPTEHLSVKIVISHKTLQDFMGEQSTEQKMSKIPFSLKIQQSAAVL